MGKSIRVNKFLSAAGHGSRRACDKLITKGKVKINGKVAGLGAVVNLTDTVTLNGKVVKPNVAEERIYIILNKPIGYITTSSKLAKQGVMPLIRSKTRVFPVGRLDVASSGLLLFTNDGDLANRLTHPRFEHWKTYEVGVDKPIKAFIINKLVRGVKLEDGLTLPAKIKQLGQRKFRISIREGKNRQIRRMCEAVGYKVKSLKRTAIHKLTLGRLKIGESRKLSISEVKKYLP